jgi:hypothetical protein
MASIRLSGIRAMQVNAAASATLNPAAALATRRPLLAADSTSELGATANLNVWRASIERKKLVWLRVWIIAPVSED